MYLKDIVSISEYPTYKLGSKYNNKFLICIKFNNPEDLIL